MKNLKKQLEQKIVEARESRKFHWNDYKRNGYEVALRLAKKEFGKEEAYRDVLQLLENNK